MLSIDSSPCLASSLTSGYFFPLLPNSSTTYPQRMGLLTFSLYWSRLIFFIALHPYSLPNIIDISQYPITVHLLCHSFVFYPFVVRAPLHALMLPQSVTQHLFHYWSLSFSLSLAFHCSHLPFLLLFIDLTLVTSWLTYTITLPSHPLALPSALWSRTERERKKHYPFLPLTLFPWSFSLFFSLFVLYRFPLVFPLPFSLRFSFFPFFGSTLFSFTLSAYSHR